MYVPEKSIKYHMIALYYLHSRRCNTEIHFVLDLESTTDLCYSCWTDLNKSHQPETNSEVAGQDNCEDMEASSHCQKCGFVFGRPCAVIQRHYLSTYLQCARTDKGLCNSFSGKKSISANVQHNLLKLTPKHRKRGSLYIPNEARKMEVDRFGCIDRSKVAVLSLVSKPDEKQSAFSRKLWEDWFEGEEPVRFSHTDMHNNCQPVLLCRHWELIRLGQFSKRQMSSLQRFHFCHLTNHQQRK